MRMKNRRWALACTVAAVSISAAACSSSPSSSSSSAGASAASAGSSSAALPAQIQILGLTDLSGANAIVGASELNGWKLAVTAVNNSGTLGSSKIVLSSEDTQSSPTQGASLASQAVAAKKYTVVMYGPSSALAIGMAPIFSRAKQNAVFIQAGSAGIVDGPTIFRLTPTLSTFYPLALKYLQGKGVKSLADIYLNDNPTYTGIDKLLGTDASTYGYTHAGSVSVTTTQTDVSAAVSKLAGMKTDAVAVLMNGAPAATVVGELRQQGYKGTIIAAPNIGAGDVLGAVGNAANGVIWPTDWAATSTVSASKAFTSAYQSAYGKAPDNYAAEAYDSVFFFADALKNAGSAGSAAVTAAMTSLGSSGFPGVLGDKLTLTDNSEIAPGQLVEWENGAITAVGS
jgi:branched-chain amino acid transport system substrate-binding protein